MKNLLNLLAAVLLVSTVAAQTSGPGTGGAPAANATSQEATGTVNDYTPETALVLDTGRGEPVHYRFAKTVKYVDADGRELQASGLRKNIRVRVHYTRDGGDLVVDKVTLTE